MSIKMARMQIPSTSANMATCTVALTASVDQWRNLRDLMPRQAPTRKGPVVRVRRIMGTYMSKNHGFYGPYTKTTCCLCVGRVGRTGFHDSNRGGSHGSAQRRSTAAVSTSSSQKDRHGQPQPCPLRQDGRNCCMPDSARTYAWILPGQRRP